MNTLHPAKRWLLDETAVIAPVLPSNHRFVCPAQTVVAGLAVVLRAAGCSEPPRACTEIGATNGVKVTVKGGLGAADARQRFVEACVAGVCGSGLLADGESAWVDLATVSSTSPVTVTVTVRQDDGSVLVPTATVVVTPSKVQPNGPGCEPTAYQAEVTVLGPNVKFTASATTS